MAVANSTISNFNYTSSQQSIKTSNKFDISLLNSIKNKFPLQWYLKRIFDLVSTLFGLIVISPILFAIAVAIKLDSKGPVLYKQKRIGYLGKEFYMYKFRSMVDNADKSQVQLTKLNETNSCMFKMFNDPRVTRVGRFLRKYSLDELPQLINVLKGEMSLVGPRPPICKELTGYKDWHYVRFAALPGLTGIWQTNGRSNIKDFDQVVNMDYSYINNWSILLDLKLLLKTVPVVAFGKDAA